MGGLILSLTLLVAGQQQQVIVPALAFEDQFEKAHDVKHHRGDVLILIYGDRKSADANRQLGEQIHVAFHPAARGQTPTEARKAPVRSVAGAAAGARSPDVITVPVALIGKVPPLVRGPIRAAFRKNSPEVPVWLDFADTMKSQFPFTAGVPNVIVLDTQGRYRYAAAGVPSADGMKRLLDTIEALRQEALANK
ncbi:MAG: hypothetical protein U0840_22160 [Gemmataceae bacterium]